MQRSIARFFVLALGVGACGNADVDTSYGSLVLEPRANDGDAEATFAGTATIVASIGYGACLEEFYREHDADAFTGNDGKATVADWRGRLCDDESREQPIDCDVVAIEQTIADGPSRLVVTFAVTGEIESRELMVGPLPDSDSADCSGGALAGLHVGTDALVGRDADGIEIWTAQPLAESVAVVDQDTAVVVYARRVIAP